MKIIIFYISLFTVLGLEIGCVSTQQQSDIDNVPPQKQTFPVEKTTESGVPLPVVVTIDKPPVVIKKVAPIYPANVFDKKGKQFVVLKVWVLKDGSVGQVEINTTSDPLFNDAAIYTIKQWQFTPALFREQPVDAWTMVTVHFNK